MGTRDGTARNRARLSAICEALPEVTSTGEQHIAYVVRGKKFAYHLVDHHGDVTDAYLLVAPKRLADQLG